MRYTVSGEEANVRLKGLMPPKQYKGTHATATAAARAAKSAQERNNLLSPDYQDELYRGPKSAWVRVCSNAQKVDQGDGKKLETPDGEPREGFVMHGVDDFHKIYGFPEKPSDKGRTILGYDVNGKEHYVKEE